ncbi:hypothetical protein L873DRAFT_1813920 [Choiromyces venosus 120613-1]|uniref:Uncharacterized protein n=1 Tax=Choiromyces venosus 120613-1 TaxID=1336337 RepID=A0A3N4J8Q7_9PEZI|nr:hypothetical protein L873DRAFT_1813920 [Choiromyces venosus 120613-1]
MADVQMLFIRPSAPASKPGAPSSPRSDSPAVSETPRRRRVYALRPSTPQTHRHIRTSSPVSPKSGNVGLTTSPSHMFYKPDPSASPGSALRPLAPLSFLSLSSSSAPLPRTPLPSSALTSQMTFASSSPVVIAGPTVNYTHNQGRKLIRSVRRMHAQICIAKLTDLDDQTQRKVGELKRDVKVFLNTAQNKYFYLKPSGAGWTFDADFSRMAMVTGKWFKFWRGVRKEIEGRRKEIDSRRKKKDARYVEEGEGGHEDAHPQ